MFSDPQTITVGGNSKTLARVGASLNSGSFRSADSNQVLSVSHSRGRRNQDRVRIDLNKIITDPLASDRNLPVSASVYLVVDTPVTGFSYDDVWDAISTLTSWLSASTFANAKKLAGGEI